MRTHGFRDNAYSLLACTRARDGNGIEARDNDARGAARPPDAPAVIVMGVSGAGKTRVGRRLSESLGWAFLDADDVHAPEDVERMRRGVPLTDEHRAPWLDRARRRIEAHVAAGSPLVVACSALKQAYRDRLQPGNGTIRFVYLKGDAALFRRRLAARSGHFMKERMLDSQIKTLEEPRDALVVNAALPVDEIVRRIRAGLGIGCHSPG